MFEWDDAQARRNVAKHGVAFDEAAGVFDDPDDLDGADLTHSAAAPRRLRIGRGGIGRVLVVAYTLRGATIRIISARRASRAERERYGEA